MKKSKVTTQQKVTKYLASRKTPATLESIVGRTGSNINTTRNVLRKMVSEGLVDKSDAGFKLV